MKWLLFFFSIYVLTLSAVPCCGDDYCCEEETAMIAGNQQHQERESHNKPELPCSPFFSCNTCHGVVIPEIINSAPAAIPLPGNIYYDPTAPSLAEFPATIWQPPQLS